MEPKYHAFRFGDWTPQSSAENMTIDAYRELEHQKLYLRLFQHTFGTHPEQPLPTGYKKIPFIVGERGIAERVCSTDVL